MFSHLSVFILLPPKEGGEASSYCTQRYENRDGKGFKGVWGVEGNPSTHAFVAEGCPAAREASQLFRCVL